jgi:hypothetical protein
VAPEVRLFSLLAALPLAVTAAGVRVSVIVVPL